MPYIAKIEPLRESISKIQALPVHKYDWINVKEYIAIYKGFVDKLAVYVLDTKGNFQDMMDEISFDLSVLSALYTNYTLSAGVLDTFHNTTVNLTTIVTTVNPNTVNMPLTNVLNAAFLLVGKSPLVITDLNNGLIGLVTDSNLILSVFYRLSLAYDKMPAPLTIIINQLTMLVNVYNQYNAIVTPLTKQVLTYALTAKSQLATIKQGYLKILNDEYQGIRKVVTDIEIQINAINDISEVQISPTVIANYELFVTTHQTKLKSVNSTIMYLFANYESFINYFDYADYSQLYSFVEDFQDSLIQSLFMILVENVV